MHTVRFITAILGMIGVLGMLMLDKASANDKQAADVTFQDAPQARSGMPLVVIHFVDSNIDFYPDVVKAIEQALAIKPELFVDIVSIFPYEDQENEEAYQVVQDHAEAIMESVVAAGISATQVRITYQADRVRYNEVQLFVR